LIPLLGQQRDADVGCLHLGALIEEISKRDQLFDAEWR
jgi:hypothetical protein